jgi:hypothetical protein
MPGDELALQSHAFDRDVPHPARVGDADGLFERRLLAGIAEDRLPAAAAGTAEAQIFRLQQRHRHAALPQMQRGRQARDAAADHAHVDARLPGERRERFLRRRAREVVIAGVEVAHDVTAARGTARFRAA